MDEATLFNIVTQIVSRGLEATRANSSGYTFTLDYVAVFAKDQREFEEMLACGSMLGAEVDPATAKTGKTFRLHTPKSVGGEKLEFLKIRTPDATRPQRGAPDFVVSDYQKFKDEYLTTSGNFTLMVRKDYEMIELKGVDVLVYLKSAPIARHLAA